MKKWMTIALLAALLSACGGGDDDPPPADPTASVPASASQSTAGLIDWLKAVTAAPSETREPLDIDALTPPLTETAEPDVVS